MFGAIVCLGCSATFHLFKDYGERAHRTLARLDYGGISVLIAASNTPPIYYSFFCDETYCINFPFYNLVWRNLYLALMYSFCFASFVVLLVP